MRGLPAVILLLTSCAPQLVLPPISATAELTATGTGPAPVVPAIPPDAPAVRREYDPASHYMRHSVTTHPGVYTGWVSKPQITFFALTPEGAPPASIPVSIGLIFRVLEPEAVQGTTLVLSCPTHTDSIAVKPASYVTPTGNTRSHFLTYTLPTDRVAAFAACSQGTLAIAQIRVGFTAAQLGGIRALLVAVGAVVGPASLPGRGR